MPPQKYVLVAMMVTWPIIALAQQSAPPTLKPKSPGEIAQASRILAEKNEGCRRQAREQKLTFLKRRQFIRNCVKN